MNGSDPTPGAAQRLLQIEETEDPVGLKLVGEVDALTAPSLARALEPLLSTRGDLTLEVSGVEFMDSAGLRVIVGAMKRLQGRGELVLQRPGRAVRRTLELSGVGTIAGLRLVD